jgi:hypothetical protein
MTIIFQSSILYIRAKRRFMKTATLGSNNVEKFGLIIIESLPENDRKTGQELYSSTIRYKLFQEPNLSAEYFDVESKSALLHLLDLLYQRAIAEKYFFVLHFEVHGSDDGLVMRNKESVNWNELVPKFRKINVHFNNLLLIHLAVCKGGNLIGVIAPEERAPFKAIVTTFREISIFSIQTGFEEFYDHFFFSFDIGESTNKFNRIARSPSNHMTLITAEFIFDKLSDIERDQENKQKQVDLVMDDIARRMPAFNRLPTAMRRELAEKKLKGMYQTLRSKRGFFLMEDIRDG